MPRRHVLSDANIILGRTTPGAIWHHIFEGKYSNPLGFGYSPSRFSDPRRSPPSRFGIYYIASSFEVAFLETIVRDKKVGAPGPLVLPKSLLEKLVHVEIIFSALSLADLTGSKPVKYGLATDVVRAQSHHRGQSAALALYKRSELFDGILYPSRFNNQSNIAVFDRSVLKLNASERRRLIDCPELANLLDYYDVSLI